MNTIYREAVLHLAEKEDEIWRAFMRGLITWEELRKLSSPFYFGRDVAVTQFERVPDAEELEGSDTSMKSQLDEAGYGSAGVM